MHLYLMYLICGVRSFLSASLFAAALAAAAELHVELESRAGRVRELQHAQEKLQVGGCQGKR